ncbi:hypothetical protein V2G26_009425 [Clonostachys chloroleuca]
MKLQTVLATVSCLVATADAHYLFGRIILDGKWSSTWEYTRQISPSASISDPQTALVAPNTDPDSLDLVCGRNASVSWAPIKTAVIQAGDTIGFGIGEPVLSGDYSAMYHPGYASAWLSKSPTDDLEEYIGDGDWFKILSVTGRTEQSRNFSDPEWAKYYDQFKARWGTFRLDSYNFTVPATTPPGKYLLRFEHIFPNPTDTQFYVNCAHVEIVNNGESGIPGPTTKIPGVYTRGQPDVYFLTYDLSDEEVENFVPPPPIVWEG